MQVTDRFIAALLICVCLTAPGKRSFADQTGLTPVFNSGDKALTFDWPALLIGTGEYEEGPTGVTVIHFTRKVNAAVDVRGGAPGTVNTDYLRLGYDRPELDAVVFAGGSAYGLEAITAVMSALKEEGLRGGSWDNIALAAGAIIYDLGDRRLNEVYPDMRLAQGALRSARPGVFPLGAHGAGRFARTGGLFGCNAYSGQGAAFRQIGNLKLAVFVVVNALGVVTRRDGRVAACYPGAGWPSDLRTQDLLAEYPASRKAGWPAAAGDAKHNTTLSLVVTNRKLTTPELKRLAIQVHTSMGRAIQPFSTQFDGDTLYAVSTGEIDAPADVDGLSAVDVNVVASELMWDAILASVPDQPQRPDAGPQVTPEPRALLRYAGEYIFSGVARLRIIADGTTLRAVATGPRSVYAIGRDAPVTLLPLSQTDFSVPNRYPLRLRFNDSGLLIVNPGPWEQTGRRQR